MARASSGSATARPRTTRTRSAPCSADCRPCWWEAEMSEFLGQGWAFPVRVNARGGLDWSAGAQSIEEAIWIILATPRRSRIMEPEFGCGLHDYVFAPNNANTRAIIASQVRSALIRWEP